MNPLKDTSAAWIVVFASLWISSVLCADYSAQSSWDGFCQTGRKQSPIDIKFSQAEVASYEPFKFNPGANDKLPLIQLSVREDAVALWDPDRLKKIKISGGGLQGEYRLQQIDFHWGENKDEGSEHLVDGKAYSLEMQALIANEESEAGAILGVLFVVSEENSPLSFLAEVDDISPKSPFDIAADVSFRQLLPNDLSQFFRYEGSSTTPECGEQLVWTIFNQTLPVSEQLLKKLRKVMPMNFRATQPLNERKLHVSFNSANMASTKQDGEGRNAGVATRSWAATYALITLANAFLAWI